ncbi:MAG: S9 family peptidase, partial [Acidimicrobiia bacterium]|nr:S9 family peptidase [Acidimicrobiia bacterium]
MKRLAIALALAVTAVLLSPAASSAKSEWELDQSSLPFDAVDGFEDSQRLWGEHNGAGYRVEVPANWNGDLIMWTHGYRGEGNVLFFNQNEFNPGLRAWMLSEGYAWAASTYSKNSYNVAQGVKDTHALARYFNGLVAKPDRIYVAGYSMGGHIAAVSAEYYGRTYSGAMPLCGVVGDYELFDYFLDINVAGQQLGLGTSQTPVDAAQFLGVQLPQIKQAFGMQTPFAFSLTESGEQFKQLIELRSGGDRPNFDAAFGFWFSIPGATGLGNFPWEFAIGDGTIAGGPGVIVDNTDTVYQVDLDPAISEFEAQLNADIARIAHDPQGRTENGLSNPPSVTGDLKMPVLTIHNLGDLFVPFNMEIEYAGNVAAQGKSDMLVQRAVRGVNHCGFSDAELIEGLSALINWVETGARPEGDVVRDPAVVAGPDYGCRFSRNDPDFHTL